MSKFDYLLMS